MIVSENRIDEIITSGINEELRKVIDESIVHSNCYGVPPDFVIVSPKNLRQRV